MKKLTSLLLLLLVVIVTNAQELVSVRGHVIDEHGNKVTAASVVANNERAATVTNEDGDFLIKLASANESLTISHLGYTSEVVEINGDKPLKVTLHSTTIMLNELLVADPKDILSMAIENIPKNYNMKPMLAKCFYRETTRKGKRYIYVAEAVTDMYKSAYNRGINMDRVAIQKARRLISTRVTDTLGAKIQGGPLVPIILDIVKNRDYLLNAEMLNHYDYSMQPSLTPTNGRNKVIVTITPRPDESTKALLGGDFYIDVNTFTIRHIDLKLDMSDRHKASEFMLEKKPAGVKFKPKELTIQIDYNPDKDGLYYLNYIRTDVSFNCDWKKKFFSSSYNVTSEMVVTDLKKDDVKPVKGRDSFREHESLFDHHEYFGDPTFWKQYNIIEPSERLEKGIKRFLKKDKK